MADGVAREELPRIAVASIQDWKRVKSNIDRAAKSVLSAVIEQQNLGASDANAVQTYFERLVQNAFHRARPNIRVNGRNFEEISEQELDIEVFDEALDRHIWSLSDQCLKWDRQIAERRRIVPAQIEESLKEVLATRQQVVEDIIIEEENVWQAEIEGEGVQAAELQLEEPHNMFAETSGLAKELHQLIPVQQERINRYESVAREVEALDN